MKTINNAERTQEPPQPGYPDRAPPAVEEPPPERLPDEAPIPNPDENRDPPRRLTACGRISASNLEPGPARWLGMVVLAGALAFAAYHPAMAQQPAPALDVGDNPCQADPGAHTERGDATLSERLDHCNGVLEPPKVGDDMVENPPEKGMTPVIDPEDLPRNEAEPQ